MNYSNYSFTLDVQSNISQVSLPVRLGDTGRKLLIGLTDGSKPYPISEGCTAKFFYKKTTPNLQGEYESHSYDCIIEDNLSTIRFDLVSAVTNLPGIVDCEIRLYGVNGKQVTSPRFIMIVDERVVYNDDIPVDDDTKNSLDNIFIVETQRADAESKRVTAESARVSAEASRVSAEEARVNAETARATAEASRVETENARKSAEASRVSAEALRVSAEEARVLAENARVSAEASRVNAETARENACSTAVSNANSAADNANDIANTLTRKLEAGEFKGEQGIPGAKGDPGKDGKDYVLTPYDKTDIANIVLDSLPTWNGGSY